MVASRPPTPQQSARAALEHFRGELFAAWRAEASLLLQLYRTPAGKQGPVLLQLFEHRRRTLDELTSLARRAERAVAAIPAVPMAVPSQKEAAGAANTRRRLHSPGKDASLC